MASRRYNVRADLDSYGTETDSGLAETLGTLRSAAVGGMDREGADRLDLGPTRFARAAAPGIARARGKTRTDPPAISNEAFMSSKFSLFEQPQNPAALKCLICVYVVRILSIIC